MLDTEISSFSLSGEIYTPCEIILKCLIIYIYIYIYLNVIYINNIKHYTFTYSIYSNKQAISSLWWRPNKRGWFDKFQNLILLLTKQKYSIFHDFKILFNHWELLLTTTSFLYKVYHPGFIRTPIFHSLLFSIILILSVDFYLWDKFGQFCFSHKRLHL